MKRTLISALITAAALLVLMGATKSKDADEFGPLLKQLYKAWNTLDPDNAASFYAKDPELVFFDVAPLQYTGWQEYRDQFKTKVAPTFASLTLKPNEDLKVIRKRDVALTTLTFHAAIKPKEGEAMEFDGRHTLFWEKREGKWVILHEHVSKPL